MTSKWAIAVFIVIAALMVLPQALAMSTGVSGPAGSTYIKFPSTAGTTLNVQNTLSQSGLVGIGMVDSGTGGVEEYYEWVSTNGLATAAAYAYMDDSDTFSYAFSGGRSATTAWASLAFSATEADYFLLGGFAFNPTNYAGTFVAGDYADSINYKNSLFASSSKVSATQSFYGTDFEELEAYTWAERGYTDDEWKDREDVVDAYDYWDDGGSWNFDDSPDPGYYDAYDGTANAISSEQYMYLDDGDILNSYKPYKSTASLYMNAATSSQSVTLNGAEDDTADVEFSSWASLGDFFPRYYGYEAETYMGAEGVTEKLGNVVYSSSSKATTALATASQSVNVYQADSIYTHGHSDNYDDELHSSELTYVNRYAYTKIWDVDHWDNEDVDSGISSSLIGTDSATARAGISSVTQQLTKASGAYIEKEITAYHEGLDNVRDYTSIFGDLNVEFTDGLGEERTDTLAREPLKASTLSGKSIATATLASSSITGNWKASIAQDMTDYEGIMVDYNTNYDGVHVDEFFGASFVRMGEAYNGDRSVKASVKTTQKAAVPSYLFREADRATELGTWA